MTTKKELLSGEKKSLRYHSRMTWTLRVVQWTTLGVIAVSGAITSFAQSEAAQASVFKSPTLLFWAGIATALAAIAEALGISKGIAKQTSRRDFHRMIVGKLERGSTTAAKAKHLIDDYFESQQNPPTY
jgi:hypothetical protein